MAETQWLIDAANMSGGVVLAAFFGAALAFARPLFAARASWRPLAAVGVAEAAVVLLALPLQPYAALLPIVFFSAYWAAAPLRAEPILIPPNVRPIEARVYAKPEQTGWAMGVAAVVVLSVFSAFDAWWSIPLIGLVVGFFVSAWQARPDFMRSRTPARVPVERVAVEEDEDEPMLDEREPADARSRPPRRIMAFLRRAR